MKIVRIINIHNFLCKIGLHNWIPIRKKHNHRIKYWIHKNIIKHRELCRVCHKKRNIEKILKKILTSPILDPEKLEYKGFGSQSKDYHFLKNGIYKDGDIGWGYIFNRRVKYWKLVYCADDQEGDDYTPIFKYKKGRK